MGGSAEDWEEVLKLKSQFARERKGSRQKITTDKRMLVQSLALNTKVGQIIVTRKKRGDEQKHTISTLGLLGSCMEYRAHQLLCYLTSQERDTTPSFRLMVILCPEKHKDIS
jgi:hypothetical protein